MEHEEFLTLIDARSDRELSPADGLRLDAHLAGCAACRGYARRSAGLARLMAAEPMPRPSEDFVDSVLSALPSKTRELPWITWRLPALAFAAAAALLLIRPDAAVPPAEPEPMVAAAYE